MDAHAIAWHADQPAANDTDKGCIELDFNALPAAVKSFEATVLAIKASGNKSGAEALKAKYVDGDG